MRNNINNINNNININIEKETKETEEKKSFFEKLWDDLKKGIKENYKVLILISIVGSLIIYINIPKELYNTSKNMSGGDIKSNMAKQAMGSSGNSDSGSKGNNGNAPKKKSMSLNPISGGVNVMMWCVKNILLLYTFLLFITLIPSIPIILYITVFYFIMTGLVGKINSV
jgi:hypothetical protein